MKIDTNKDRGQDDIKIKAEIFKPRNDKDWHQTSSSSERDRKYVFPDRPQTKAASLMPLSPTSVPLDSKTVAL